MSALEAIIKFNAGLLSKEELESKINFINMGSDTKFYRVRYSQSGKHLVAELY